MCHPSLAETGVSVNCMSDIGTSRDIDLLKCRSFAVVYR